MIQSTHFNPNTATQEDSSNLLRQIRRAITELLREERSRKAKEAWQRRRKRMFRTSNNEALIYVRSSNADTLEIQAAILKDKATQLGLHCTRMFYDNCPATDSPFDRSGFSKLMETVQATATVSTILTLDPSRICRSRKHWPYLKSRLNELDVQLIYAR